MIVKTTLYHFDPPTQMQKDIWLGEFDHLDKVPAEAIEAIKQARLGSLRWLCRGCGTVQDP